MKNLNLRWTEGFLDKVSKFEFLLLEVAVLLVVFVIVNQANPDIEAYETRELSSMTVVWSRPTGYASFIDSGNKQAICTSSSNTNCLTAQGTYWPGSSVIYTVKVGSREGVIFKEGGTSTNSLGQAKATWSWNYSVVVWPNSFATCQLAGADCKTSSNISNNNKDLYYTFGELKANTDYRVVVCAPNCGAGTKIVDRVQKTAIPAKLNPVANESMSCVTGADGKQSVNINFYWTVASGGVFDQQWIDYSVNENFASGYTQSFSLPVGQNTYPGVNFLPGTQYYWRINSRLGYSANAWVTSSTGLFKTPTCGGVVAITCEQADVNRDGQVNSLDYAVISRQISLPYDPKYDFDKNGKVENADVLYAATKAGTCTSTPYAIKLAQKTTCSSLGAGDLVRVDYSWQTGVGATQQFLDFDIAPHGDTGWPTSTSVPISVGQNTSALNGFAQDVTYYWRINTKGSNGVWYPSAVKSFKTPKCYLPSEPTNLNVTMGVTTKKADGSLCTDSSYGVVFSWTSQGASGWFVDVSTNNSFSPSSNRDVSGRTNLTTTGSDFAPALTFEPGKTYYWRMYVRDLNKWYLASIPAFRIDYCNPPFLNEIPSGWPTEHGRISQGPYGGVSHGSLAAIDIENNTSYYSVDNATPIRATFDGIVTEVCVDGGTCNYGNLGNAVIMENPNSAGKVIYAHLSSFLVGLGSNVKKGDIIGGMGSTGYATGVHLHYEFRGIPITAGVTVPSITLGEAW